MTLTPKKRRGRPRKDPTSTEPLTFHLGLRFDERTRAKLEAIVFHLAEQSRASGIPAALTPSSLVTFWIGEKIEQEWQKLPPPLKAKARD